MAVPADDGAASARSPLPDRQRAVHRLHAAASHGVEGPRTGLIKMVLARRAGPSDEAVAPAIHLRACVPRRGCKHEVRLNRMTHAHPLGHEVRVALLRKIQFDAIHHLTCSRVRAPTLFWCARTAANRSPD